MPSRHMFLTRTVLQPYGNDPTFVLTMWDAGGRASTGQHLCGYQLVEKGKGVIFRGDDYGCSPMDPIDSEDCVRGILGFLFLRPGDTDSDYFENYTEAQLAFADEHGESLSLYTIEDRPIALDRFEIL